MFDLTTYVKEWQIRQLKTVFSTLDTVCADTRQTQDKFIPLPEEVAKKKIHKEDKKQHGRDFIRLK